MNSQVELLLILLSILFFLSILAGKASSKFGIPSLLLFLSVGMLFGSDGLGIQFENTYFAQAISTIALCIILFSGGMDTKLTEVRPIIKQGIVLATVGVFLTAIITGILIWLLLDKTPESAGMGFLTAILLAATMSSTDSASVFSILRSRNLQLKNNLKPLLELESGSNDPMAYILVITIIELIKMNAAPDYVLVGVHLFVQLLVGGVAGFLLGKLSVFIINKIKIGNDSLYPILLFTLCIFIFSFTYFIKGNSYLAVYIAGLVIGNSKFVHKRSSVSFFDGLAWLSQLLMFLTLGLLVNPRELIPILVPGLIISFIIIFIGRPLSVFLSLLPFKRMQIKDKTFVSWVGLKGAVPIIFAIIPLAENLPHARIIFNIVFLCTIVSLLLQGSSLPLVAKWLGLIASPEMANKPVSNEFINPESPKSSISEFEVSDNVIKRHKYIMDLPLSDDSYVVLIKRDGNYIIPSGKSKLEERDILLIITTDQKGLEKTFKSLNFDYQV